MSIKDAVCGPQVLGTDPPSDMSSDKWASLNPCPLNACCDAWGQCGISPEFCTATPLDTGAPGTTRPGKNGCISNCGMDVMNNSFLPKEVKRVGYFEAWNANRPCLHMDILSLHDQNYCTHVHFGFGNLTSDWQVDVSGIQDQFEGLLELQSVKRVISLGGWAFSRDPGTYRVFRTSVESANRQTFAQNVVKFIVDNDLDGVAFDWEYPGAQDIPGIPPDSLKSGAYYLEFLKLVRALLPSDKTVSIAAPASYWYLNASPIAKIADVVDYIIYMTYNLHGQWDYGNKFVDPSCSNGNCLRSQVNKTETSYALAMITKAGVPAMKVVAGLPLYGQSFEIAEAGCVTSECLFTGPTSGATPGPSRMDGLSFGGTSDWAIDLNGTCGDNPSDLGDDGVWASEGFVACDYSRTLSSLDDLNSAAGGLRTDCLAVYTLQVLIDMLNTAYTNYTNVNSGYDEIFRYYVTYMEKLVPQVAANEFMFNSSTIGQYATFPNVGFGINYFSCKLGDGTVIVYSDFNTTKYREVEGAKTTALTLTDENGYLRGLTQAGLDPDWVVLGDYSFDRDVTAPHRGRKFHYAFAGFPVENTSMVVPDPKIIVTQGLGSIPDLLLDMQATLLDMVLGIWSNGSVTDPAQACSTPVFMLMQAVDGMAQAKQLGQQEQQEEEEEAKCKKDFILLIVSVVLMFVPVVGEELAITAVFATLARAIAIAVAGELGNAALAIYDTVEDPKSAVVNILGMLLGVGAITNAARDGVGICYEPRDQRGFWNRSAMLNSTESNSISNSIGSSPMVAEQLP
ncbi:hypothetical protein MMC25_004064 [Agyrium rufum]|nr:hypothetical protein [Agyrium rufum]